MPGKMAMSVVFWHPSPHAPALMKVLQYKKSSGTLKRQLTPFIMSENATTSDSNISLRT